MTWMSKEKDNPGPFVTRTQCSEMMGKQSDAVKAYVKEQVDPVRIALVGSDPLNPDSAKIPGLVKTVGDIKRKLDVAKTLADNVKPVVYAVIGVIITVAVTKLLGL